MGLGMTKTPIAEQKAKPFDLATTNMMCRQVADSVWAVMADNVERVDHAATNAGFVVGSDAILAVESLSNKRLCDQMLQGIRDHGYSPRYLVNTSFHGDHCFGNYAVPSETVIIAHELTCQTLTESFEVERDHMVEFMGHGSGVERVELRVPELRIRDTVEIDLGNITVEVEPIGLIQTPGDVAVHVREQRVVFVGNAINAPPPAIPWVGGEPIDEVITSYNRFQASLDPDTTIVTGHGNFMKPSEINFSVQYLEELASTVDDYVRRGLDVEALGADPNMARYSAYSMFSLAHLKVNVPAQYERIAAG
jgi:glyoxylase-like metal-dependent hydrolase (beta-lactamase superfamily II)